MLTVTKDITIMDTHAWEKIIVENGILTFQADCYSKHIDINGGKMIIEAGILKVTGELPAIPIVNAKVQIYDANKTQLFEEKFTDENGMAVFSLPPNTYCIVVSKSDYETREQLITVDEDKSEVIELEYTPDP